MKTAFLIAGISLVAFGASAQYYQTQPQQGGYYSAPQYKNQHQQYYQNQSTYQNNSAYQNQGQYNGQYQPQAQQQYRPQNQQNTYQAQPKRRQNNTYNGYNGSYDNTPFRQEYKHQNTMYVTPRIGFGAIFLESDNFSSPNIDIAAGMYFGNFRSDIELTYHFESEIVEGLDISQYDVFLNGYYDFDTGSPFKPFIGIGAGLSTVELSLDDYWYHDDEYSEETNFALSVQAGASFDITDNMALEIMGRYRYMFTTGNVYNLEALAGLRVSF